MTTTRIPTLSELSPEPTLSRQELWRLRDIFSELSRHGETHRLLHRMGVDEGELAQACGVIVALLSARITADLQAQAEGRRE